MPKFFSKRTANEIRAFLEAHDFIMVNRNGDDQIWAKRDNRWGYTVKLPDRNEEIPRGTLDNIKKCIGQCGHDRKSVISWWKANGYGE